MEIRGRLGEIATPVIGGLVVLLTLILVIGTAVKDPKPHDIAVAIVGPTAAVSQLRQGFAANAPGAFKFTTYDSDAAARAALDSRDAVAALILGQPPRLVVAGAAGEAVTSGVTAALTAAFKGQGTSLAVETVHPFQAGDAHGILLFFLVFATLVSSLLAGALAGLRIATRRGGLAAVIAFALSAGICGALAVAWLAEGYGEHLWEVMAITTLAAFAVAIVTTGLVRVIGAAGAALSALVLVLLGVISGGGPLGSELLPDAYRVIAPWLPAGPTYSALRGALYFSGVGVWGPVTLLSVYALLGIAVLALRRTPTGGVRRVTPATAS